MPSIDQFRSSSCATCPSANELREYLAGWIEESQAARIDGHLQSCHLCDLALKELENHHDTLLQSLQLTVEHAGAVEGRSNDFSNDNEPVSGSIQGNDGLIDAALEQAKRLIDTSHHVAAEKARATWQPAIRELGIYELIRPLGRGGMGAVYLAVHRQLRKQVAIKLLPLMSVEDSDVRARFEREIRVVGKLNHPSIVAATDAGEIDGIQFLVMEYVPGLDLSRLARLMGRLPVAESCELIRQVALGLSCAHAEGVVHRDVKPSNLMLDESGRIRILDFGLAQLSVWDEASVDLTTVGQLMGTLDYMAPEQAELSGSVDYRADLYALGATLFRLLCGRPPLAAAPNQSPLEKLRLLASHQPPKLDTLCAEAPLELVQLVSSMLARNPQNRPASAAHVAEQLAPLATGSNLVELLEKAMLKAASSPERAKETQLGDLPAVFPQGPASSAQSAFVLQPANVNTGRGKPVRWLLMAASLPLVLVAGILIKVELDKGQLVIESDVDNVQVTVLRDSKPVDGIQISHGATSTRLQADQYEITIDGPSDGLIIDKSEFTLKSGETVVARISRKPSVNAEVPHLPDSLERDNSQGQPIREVTVQLVERVREFSGRMSLKLLLQKPDGNNRVNATENVLTALTKLETLLQQPHSDNQVLLQLDVVRELSDVFIESFNAIAIEHVEVQKSLQLIENDLKQLYAATRTENNDARAEFPATSSADSPSAANIRSSTLSPAARARLKSVAASLVKLTTELDKPISQWKGRDPLSIVVSSFNRFRVAAVLFEQLQAGEYSPDELQMQTVALYQAWKEVYFYIGQCDTSQREQLSEIGGRIRSDLSTLHELVPEAVSSTLNRQDEEMSTYATRDPDKITAPLYDGKPLDHWLDMLNREKSAAGLKSAFEACGALATETNGEQIANVVLHVVPKLPSYMNLEPDPAKSRMTVDGAAEGLLRRTLPGPKFYTRWVAEFDAGETDWRERLWKFVSNASTIEEAEPFVAWAEQRLNQKLAVEKDTDQDSTRAADQLRNMIGVNSPLSTAAFRNRIVGILTSSPQLPVSWWLSQPLIYRSDETDREIWPLEFKVEVTRRAIEALQNIETPPSLVVQASIILAHNIDLTAEQQSTISGAINRHLESLAKDRSSLTQMVQASQEFTRFSVPVLDYQNPLNPAPLQIQVRHQNWRGVAVLDNSIALMLLNHAWKIDKGVAAKSQLDQIFRLTRGTLERIQTHLISAAVPRTGGGTRPGGSGRGSRAPVQLLWPDLQTANANRPVDPFGNSGTYQRLETATLWGKYEPTKQDWLEYLILLHPIMTERVTEAVKEFSAAPAENVAPAEKTE